MSSTHLPTASKQDSRFTHSTPSPTILFVEIYYKKLKVSARRYCAATTALCYATLGASAGIDTGADTNAARIADAAAGGQVPAVVVAGECEVAVALDGAVKAVAVSGGGDAADATEVSGCFRAWRERETERAALNAKAGRAAVLQPQEFSEGGVAQQAAAAAVPGDCLALTELSVPLVCGYGEVESGRILLPIDTPPGKYVIQITDGVLPQCLRHCAVEPAARQSKQTGTEAGAEAGVGPGTASPAPLAVSTAGSAPSLLPQQSVASSAEGVTVSPGAPPTLEGVRHMARLARPVQTNRQVAFFVDPPSAP